MDIPKQITDACPGALQGASAQLFMLLINTLVSEKCKLDTKHLYPKDYAPHLQDGDEFDFIIVGSGSAGSVVASRLSEIANWKILLVEAGDYPSEQSEIPGMVDQLSKSTEDWGYKMEPSKLCCTGLTNNVCPCPRGKGLGGSSLTNGMAYVRSTRSDHESWVMNGNEGWDYDSAVKHYKNFENVQTEDIQYGKGGELNITGNVIQNSILKLIPDVYKEMGFTEYTNDSPMGYQQGLLTISEGKRQHAAKAFLTKAKNRPNLFVALNAQVGKLTLDEGQSAVTGIEVKINGQILSIKARNEVILSAGSINSPQILMNSGIGPKQHLSELEIKVVRDLPVGENLQDHLMFPGFLVTIKSLGQSSDSPISKMDALYQYLIHKKGPLLELKWATAGYLNTQNVTDRANIQMHHLTYPKQDYSLEGYVKYFELPEQNIKILTEYNKNLAVMSLMPILLHPKSRGYIKLQNNDPFDKPKIIPNFFSDKKGEDMKVMIDAIEMAKRITKTKTLSKLDPKFINVELPNCSKYTRDSDAFWECAVRNLAQTLFHPIGTCKMGPKTDPAAVVDPLLKVHGLMGIRVIDGSIMPTLTSGNTQAPITMIGEKGADLIKEQWLPKRNEL